MRIGIGIDTGGTCTDAVVYRRSDRTILATAKTSTTKEDLSIGIGAALDALPEEYRREAEVVALSTTLATNACVENKGGRAKLIFFGVQRENVERVGRENGIALDENLLLVKSHTRPGGEIVSPPDWEVFRKKLPAFLCDCDAVGVVEMYAKKTGGALEKKACELIRAERDIPVVCGYELAEENNAIRRGATALLNARLLSVIDGFLKAVDIALKVRGITAPVVMVRSDGSLMNTAFTAEHPVETLLSGPVASVMGAMELAEEENALIVDIGGTTTDIAFVKKGMPQRVEGGVRIGSWNTFVKGLFVDTFGLGGDSGVRLTPDRTLELEEEKVMPLAMAAAKYPELLTKLRREDRSGSRLISVQKEIYLALRVPESGYTEKELRIAAALTEPKSLEELKEELGDTVMPHQLNRLLREGVLIRCGVTPTDAMHFKGEFTAYSTEAAQLGLSIMARQLLATPEELAEGIYDAFRRKLYFGIARALMEEAYPAFRDWGFGQALEKLIRESYDRADDGGAKEFLGFAITTPVTLVGVGAPTARFLPEVGRRLGTKVKLSPYSSVANALGAVVGQVSSAAVMEISYRQETDDYLLFGCGLREKIKKLPLAKEAAEVAARARAREDAVARGAAEDSLSYTVKEEENAVETEFGPVYMGYRITVTASGQLRLTGK